MNIEKELQNAIETANKANEAVLELKKKYEESLKPKSKVLWKPKDGDKVWFVAVYGKPTDVEYSYKVHGLYMRGELFPTKEACQKYIDKTLATQRVLRKLRELEGDYVYETPKMGYGFPLNTFVYDESKAKFKFAVSGQTSKPIEWYSTEEACMYVIENMQDDLKLAWGIDD